MGAGAVAVLLGNALSWQHDSGRSAGVPWRGSLRLRFSASYQACYMSNPFRQRFLMDVNINVLSRSCIYSRR
jgi:hypothetical protein